MNGFEGACEEFLTYGHSVDLDSFGRLDEMGRGVQSGANACGAESGVDHGAGGTFSVGAGDVDHAIGTLGIAEVGEYGLNALQAEFSGEDFVAQGKEKMFRFGVSHFGWIQFRGRLVQAGQTAERGGELHGSENSLGDRFRPPVWQQGFLRIAMISAAVVS